MKIFVPHGGVAIDCVGRLAWRTVWKILLDQAGRSYNIKASQGKSNWCEFVIDSKLHTDKMWICAVHKPFINSLVKTQTPTEPNSRESKVKTHPFSPQGNWFITITGKALKTDLFWSRRLLIDCACICGTHLLALSQHIFLNRNV